MDNQKKTAAAIAAVMSYIKTEEEAACAQAAMLRAQAGQAQTGAPVAPNLWGLSGR